MALFMYVCIMYVCMYVCAYVWNQNSIHPPHRNFDVLSDTSESTGGSPMSVEFLFRACWDGGSTKSKKYDSSKYILAICFLKSTDKTASSVTHITYCCMN